MKCEDMTIEEQLKYCSNKDECKGIIEHMKTLGLTPANVGGMNGDDGLFFSDEDGNVLSVSVCWLDEEEAEDILDEG